LDGSNPNHQSLLYSGPFQVSETLRDGYDAWRRQNFLDALDALGLLNP
jgi:hypothetical protein